MAQFACCRVKINVGKGEKLITTNCIAEGKVGSVSTNRL